METKICTRCERELPCNSEFFYKSTANKNGLMYHCKECHTEAVKRWRAENPEKVREHRQRYNKLHPGRAKEWREANRDIIREYQREYQREYAKNNRDKVNEMSRRWYKENAGHVSEYNSQRQLKKIGIENEDELGEEVDVSEYEIEKPVKGKRGRPKGFRMKKESRDKIAEARRGTEHTVETRQKISATMRGRRQPDVSRTDWKQRGSEITDNRGYVLVYVGNGTYIRRCRLVASEKLGRVLSPQEVVHHWSGNKLDDEPTNLFVCSARHHGFIHKIYEKRGISGINWVTKEEIR